MAAYQAQAAVEAAKAQFAVPAQEQTRQVKWIASAMVVVVLAALYAIVHKSDAAPAIASLVGVFGVVFGGMYYVTKKAKDESQSGR